MGSSARIRSDVGITRPLPQFPNFRRSWHVACRTALYKPTCRFMAISYLFIFYIFLWINNYTTIQTFEQEQGQRFMNKRQTLNWYSHTSAPSMTSIKSRLYSARRHTNIDPFVYDRLNSIHDKKLPWKTNTRNWNYRTLTCPLNWRNDIETCTRSTRRQI